MQDYLHGNEEKMFNRSFLANKMASKISSIAVLRSDLLNFRTKYSLSTLHYVQKFPQKFTNLKEIRENS